MTAADRNPRFRAPVENGQVLCDPPWNTLLDWAASRGTHKEIGQAKVFDLTISQLSNLARNSAISGARAYTSQYAESADAGTLDGPLIFTGHQPDLFHPGVWYKNFTAARLANSCGGSAINLIVDSDLCRTPAIRIPAGSAKDPAIEHVAYDQIAVSIPYEERLVSDRRLWETFGERASDIISPLVGEPLVRHWWPTVVASSFEAKLGTALSQARHRLERDWGSHSWELPQSRLCQTEAFRLFALHLIVNAKRFRSAYNSSLAEYRKSHHLRNRAQPVPDLHIDDGWIESPFWLWSTADPIRRPLYVRDTTCACQLTDRNSFVDTLPIDCDVEPGLALSKLADWEARGIKLRTRALTTTLFVRLLLAEVFIHGIGGAKYDQVTDTLCQSFFDVSLPAYATVSGTLRLPITRTDQELASVNNLRQELRNLKYHPERQKEHMRFDTKDKAQIEQLISMKQQSIHMKKTPENGAERHAVISSANRELQQWLSDRQDYLEHELSRSLRQADISRILDSREYSYCLFPSDTLKEFLLK